MKQELKKIRVDRALKVFKQSVCINTCEKSTRYAERYVKETGGCLAYKTFKIGIEVNAK